MNIGSGNGYPASALSNFAPHRFVLDGVECASMEGFLQSLKFKNPEMQRHICSLVGRAAKFAGKQKKWWLTGTLYWQGREIDRFSGEYQQLLDRAYDAMVEQSNSFRDALHASENATLEHTIGKSNPRQTILTVSEFIKRLYRIREELI